jgi:hypothetical protein
VASPAKLLNGVGLALHHWVASLMICMTLVGIFAPDRHDMGPPLLLIVQQHFVLFKYHNMNADIAVEHLLEVLFELMVLSEYQHIRSNHWVGGLAAPTMLVTHWFFLIAAVLEMHLPWKQWMPYSIGQMRNQVQSQPPLEHTQSASGHAS